MRTWLNKYVAGRNKIIKYYLEFALVIELTALWTAILYVGVKSRIKFNDCRKTEVFICGQPCKM